MNHARIWLKLDKIDLEKSVQMREALDLETVAEYQDALAQGEELPPVTVFRDGSGYYLVDGWHRLKAHEGLKKKEIEVKIINGTYREAVLYAIGANATHGKKRTLADKEKAVLFLMKDEEWGKLSDAALMKAAKITDAGFMGRLRKKYDIERKGPALVERNGRMVRVNVQNMGRQSTDYGPRLHGLKYNDKISPKFNRVMRELDSRLTSGTKQFFSKEQMFRLRLLLTNAMKDVENRILAASVKRGKR